MINLFDPKSNTCPRAVRRCSAQTWLSAVAPCHRPRSARTEVTIAFQLPEARANEWSKHLSCIQYIALLCEFALQTASHLYRKQFALQTARNLLCKLQSELVRNFELTGATKVGNEGGSPATSTEWIHALFLHEPRESVGYVVLTSSAFRNFPGNQTTTDGRTQLSWQFRRGQGRLWLLVTKALGHKELRWVSRPSGSPTPTSGSASFPEQRALCKTPSGFFGTSLPSNWTLEEVEFYDRLFADLNSKSDTCSSRPDTGIDPLASLQSEYLEQCGLPRRALREIWQVANPHLKTSLGLEEFRASCRLVGHCQAMSLQDEKVPACGGLSGREKTMLWKV